MSKARDIASATPAPSIVSATELGYLDGVTSAVQTQIDSKIGQSTAINPTIVDAKGDIIAATAADTVARLAVGTNNQVLTADSSTATGLKWATASSGGMTLLSTTTLSGASTTISGIDQTYTDLYVRIDQPNCASSGAFRIAPNGTTTSCFMTGSYYDRSNSALFGLNFTYVTAGGIGNLKPNNTESNFHLYINGYSTNYTKKTALFYGTFINPSDIWHSIHFGGHISDGSQISSLVFTNSAGNLTGGTVYVYGVK